MFILRREADERSVDLGLVDIIHLLLCLYVVGVSGKLQEEAVHLRAELVHLLHLLLNVLNINFFLIGYLF